MLFYLLSAIATHTYIYIYMCVYKMRIHRSHSQQILINQSEDWVFEECSRLMNTW